MDCLRLVKRTWSKLSSRDLSEEGIEQRSSFPLAGTGEEREVESRESFACFGGAAARKRLDGLSSPGSDWLPASRPVLIRAWLASNQIDEETGKALDPLDREEGGLSEQSRLGRLEWSPINLKSRAWHLRRELQWIDGHRAFPTRYIRTTGPWAERFRSTSPSSISDPSG